MSYVAFALLELHSANDPSPWPFTLTQSGQQLRLLSLDLEVALTQIGPTPPYRPAWTSRLECRRSIWAEVPAIALTKAVWLKIVV